MLKKIIPLVTLLVVFISCEQDSQTNDQDPSLEKELAVETQGDLPAEIQELIGKFTEKRKATSEEIAAFQKENSEVSLSQKIMSCSLDSDAGCSSESTPEFLFYVSNCVTFPLPTSGGFNITYTRAAISYYVDGDGDVNCDNYEDDLQAMIDGVVSSVGGSAWAIYPSVYLVSPCNERSNSNFIVFDLEVWVP